MATLKDDGTLDTVIACDLCGREHRFTYAMDLDSWPNSSDEEISQQQADADAYQQFVASCCDEVDSDCEHDINGLVRYASEMLQGYVSCALWLFDPEPCSGEWEPHDHLTLEGLADTHLEWLTEAATDCADFARAQAALLERYAVLRGNSPIHGQRYSAMECAGHDFYLSRNGHGAGFFDRGPEPEFRQLQDACKPYGTHELI